MGILRQHSGARQLLARANAAHALSSSLAVARAGMSPRTVISTSSLAGVHRGASESGEREPTQMQYGSPHDYCSAQSMATVATMLGGVVGSNRQSILVRRRKRRPFRSSCCQVRASNGDNEGLGQELLASPTKMNAKQALYASAELQAKIRSILTRFYGRNPNKNDLKSSMSQSSKGFRSTLHLLTVPAELEGNRKNGNWIFTSDDFQIKEASYVDVMKNFMNLLEQVGPQWVSEIRRGKSSGESEPKPRNEVMGTFAKKAPQGEQTEKRTPIGDRNTNPQKTLWGSCWYPLAFTTEIDKRRPHAFQLLGAPIVIWWDGESHRWTGAVDRCPHRWARLSEGRVNDKGHIECVYHGWSFSPTGHFKGSSKMRANTMVDKRRGCLKILPVRERQGLLWVWAATLLESSAAPDSLTLEEFAPEALDDSSIRTLDYFRDVPVDSSLLCESFIDPSKSALTRYIPLLQEGAAASDSSHLRFNLTSRKGFSANIGEESKPAQLDFRAPHLLVRDTHQDPSCIADWTAAYAVPVGPGRSRLILRVAVDLSAVPAKKRLFVRALLALPTWVLHGFVHRAVEEDTTLMHELSMSMRESGRVQPHDWKGELHYKTADDSLPAAYRSWLDQYTDGVGPCWSSFAEPASLALRSGPRASLIERETSHHQHCRSCFVARRRAKWGCRAAEATMAASLGVAAITSTGPALGIAGLALAMRGLCGAVSEWLTVPASHRRHGSRY